MLAHSDIRGHKPKLAHDLFFLASKERQASVLECTGIPLSAIRLPIGLRVLSGAIVIAFLVHLTLTEASFGLMTCTDLAPDPGADLAEGDAESMRNAETEGFSLHLTPGIPDDCPAETASRRLVLDLDVCCYNAGALGLMFGVGVPAVLLFAVGIPLAAGLRLWLVRRHLWSPDVLATLGFLMAGFKVNTFFWEVVIMLRKLAVVAITVLIEPWGVRVQTYSALAVIFAASVLHSLYQPYKEAQLNALELVALVGAFLTFESGLFINDPNSGSATVLAATFMVFVANLSVMVFGLYVIRRSILRWLYRNFATCCNGECC